MARNSHLDRLHLRPHGSHDPDPLVAERHVHPAKVRVGAAHPRVGDVHIDLVARQVRAPRGALVDGAVGRALEDGEVERHPGCAARSRRICWSVAFAGDVAVAAGVGGAVASADDGGGELKRNVGIDRGGFYFRRSLSRLFIHPLKSRTAPHDQLSNLAILPLPLPLLHIPSYQPSVWSLILSKFASHILGKFPLSENATP
jgi:hypothetical protein